MMPIEPFSVTREKNTSKEERVRGKISRNKEVGRLLLEVMIGCIVVLKQ